MTFSLGDYIVVSGWHVAIALAAICSLATYFSISWLKARSSVAFVTAPVAVEFGIIFILIVLSALNPKPKPFDFTYFWYLPLLFIYAIPSYIGGFLGLVVWLLAKRVKNRPSA